jgi:uncharacterized membrane protein HdeD (DUF308 family)
MVNDVKTQTERSHFPADVLAILVLPAFAIFALFFGPQRGWIILLLIGMFELAVGVLGLRRSKSSLAVWLAIMIGIIALAAGIRFAFAPF